MFRRNRGTVLVFILLLLAHLDATERQGKSKESQNPKNQLKTSKSVVSTSGNNRLKEIHDSDIEKLIAGSSKFIRSRPTSSDNRALPASKENDRGRESSRHLGKSMDKTNGKGKNLKTKSETRKKPKLTNMRKSQPKNANLRKKKISPIPGCATGGKGKKKGHACHNAGRKVKRFVNIPGVEVIEQWNKTCIIPIPSWFWPSFWAIFR